MLFWDTCDNLAATDQMGLVEHLPLEKHEPLVVHNLEPPIVRGAVFCLQSREAGRTELEKK